MFVGWLVGLFICFLQLLCKLQGMLQCDTYEGRSKFLQVDYKEEWKCYNLHFIFQYNPEFNAFATFFWQTVNSTKIEIFCLSLQPLLGSFLERFIVRIADMRSESSATWHDNVTSGQAVTGVGRP